MSEDEKNSAPAEDSISTSEDTIGSSISLSLGESSVRLREKIKPTAEKTGHDKIEEKKWWLKRPDTRLGISTSNKNSIAGNEAKQISSPDVSSSMKEFLEKEKFCKQKSDAEEKKDKDDTLCDILASAAFDKYPSDFENATDEDIGSFLEEMSKIAGALSPSSVQDRPKSGEDSSKNPTEEEKSVEELLEEAEKLVRENVGLSKSASRSEMLVLNDDVNFPNVNNGHRMEEDIFHLIEREVHRESEKIRKSPKADKMRREASPSIEIIYENVNNLKAPKLTNLERQKNHFDDNKVEVSSSSDLDDPIDRHSKSDKPKKLDDTQKDKENLQKEITDVDKDFFDDLLRRSKNKIEGGISGSSSFGQEDFSHFLRILQGQDSKKNDNKDKRNVATIVSDEILTENYVFPEKEITEILKKEFSDRTNNDNHEFSESDSSARSIENATKRKTISRSCSVDSKKSSKSNEESKKVVNSKSELYTVGLTPRLELFADAIPKLIAEKSEENLRKEEKLKEEKSSNIAAELVKENMKKDVKMIKNKNPIEDESISKIEKNVENREIFDKTENRSQARKIDDSHLLPSKSYDQLSKPQLNLRSSLDDIRLTKSTELSRRPYQQSVKSSLPQKSVKISSKVFPSKSGAKMKLSLKPSSAKLPSQVKSSIKSEIPLKYSLAGGDCRKNVQRNDNDTELYEERRKNIFLKEQIDSEAKIYKQQMQNMRTNFEEELFALKKQNIILKAKIDELSINDKRVESPTRIIQTTTKIQLLENELEKQETMINTYETENKKLLTETKKLRDEMKNIQNRKKILDVDDTLKLNDTIKDLREDALKLNLEISELRQKNDDLSMRLEDVMQQESLLKEELDMFKEQLKTKNDFINARLQTWTTNELESRKRTEDLKIELSSKTEQLKSLKNEYDKLEKAVLPLEKELLELRLKDSGNTEKLQIAKTHVEREKQLTIKLKDQVILDNKKILDLNRQVREMERILKRKNPDSVSALILTAKSDNERINLEKVKLLEDRVASLEGEIQANEVIGQEKLIDLQKKFAEMKEKYVFQVMELEGKLIEATTKERKIFNDMFTQTIAKNFESKSVETLTNMRERSGSIQTMDREQKCVVKVGPKSQNPKEDAHLIATIRGLKLEMVNKDKNVTKITKECQELQKTNRKLQKEREKLLNDRRNFRGNEMPERNGKDPKVTTKNGDDQNSNFYQNGHFSNGQKISGSVTKLYDPLQYSENGDNANTKKLANENDILKEELNKINKDFMTLKNKRLHDLNLLQEEHEREMAELVKEYSVKFGDSKVVKLQGQINTQVTIITHLKQQIEKLRDYKEQVIVLKVEREHLENKVKILNEKVKYLSTPGTEQLQLLQDKITILQQRHESREMTLQSLVRDLLRNRTQCRDCKGEKGKSSKQLCYFRQELDNILGMLQEISNVR